MSQDGTILVWIISVLNDHCGAFNENAATYSSSEKQQIYCILTKILLFSSSFDFLAVCC